MATNANAIQMRGSLTINNGNLVVPPIPFNFVAAQSLAIGPTPGSVLATKQGTNVNLSVLVQPGVCTITNLDTINYVEIGVWDPITNEFYVLLEALPGETWPMRLSRFLGEDIGTGSGTTPGGTGKQLRIKGIGGACWCNVLAYNA